MPAAYDWWKGIFLFAHAQHELFQKCVDVSCLIMPLSFSSGLSALWESGWFRHIQTSTFRASHQERPLLFCAPLPSYWEEDQRDNGHVGRFGGEPKKAPKPLDNTNKQIFMHVISKSSIWLSKCSFKGEKYICFCALLWDRPASLVMLYIRTVQCLQISFWTLQYLLLTQLPKNLSASGADSRTLIHVLKQHFYLPWKRNPSAISRTTVCWFSKLICQKRCKITFGHAGFRLHLGHCTENQLCSLQLLVPQYKEVLRKGQPRRSLE